jgi:hypothetical protein
MCVARQTFLNENPQIQSLYGKSLWILSYLHVIASAPSGEPSKVRFVAMYRVTFFHLFLSAHTSINYDGTRRLE